MHNDKTAGPSHLSRRVVWAACVLAVFLIAADSALAAESKQVLLLHSYGRDFAPFNTYSEAFRTELGQRMAGRVEFHDVALESALFGEEAAEEPLMDYLSALFRTRRLDLVVPIGGPAVRYAQKHRQRLFPATPMLLACADQRHFQTAALTTNDAVIPIAHDPIGVVEGILEVLPQTTNIVMMLGNSPVEKFWFDVLHRLVEPLTNRVSFVWFNGLSFAEIQKRAAALPPNSAIDYVIFSMDAEGVPYAQEQALARLHAVANAPIFGQYDSQMGGGVVGGRLIAVADGGRNAAAVAVRILQGEVASRIEIPAQGPGSPVYDFRELKRWGVRPERLPPGSRIEFREPTFWEQYRWYIAGVVGFCGLQTVLIIALFVNRAKLREEQATATLIADLSSNFINLPPDEVDREIEDAQRRVCEHLGLEVSALWQCGAGTSSAYTLTHLYRPSGGPPTPEQMDGREYFPWSLQQLVAGKVIAISSMDQLPPEAAHDLETYRHYGVKSTLTVPLSAGGGPAIGFLSFNAMRAERPWPEVSVRRLQQVAQIIANALERKHSEQTLRESEERLSLATDSAGAGLWSMNLNTRKVWVNSRMHELFQFGPAEELTYDSFGKVIHPEDREAVTQAVQRAVETDAPLMVEYRIVRPDGGLRWIIARGRRHCMPSGKPDCLMGVTVDITARREAEEALRKVQTTLRAIIDSTDDLIWSVDAVSFGLMTFNEGLHRHFLEGRGLRLSVGMRPEDLFPAGEYVERWRGFYQRALGEGSFTTEYRVFTQDKILLLSFNVLKREGQVFGISAFGKNITERKRVEAAARDFSARLIKTQEEERARLARELHDDITQRLASLAIGAGRVARAPVDAALAETMREVREELARLSEDVHALAYRLHPSVLEDLGLAEALRAEVDRFTGHDSVPVEVKVSDLPDSVPKDAALCLFRVAQEALRNAVRHAQARTVRISLRGLDGGVQLAVRDDGIGFNPAQHPERPSLGLASMRERVRLLGGEFDIESAPGQGTTIVAWVPLAKTEG